jgi:RsiW-degrading membrane proteinase PrsW (M82 family)
MNTDKISASEEASACATCPMGSCSMSDANHKKKPATRVWYVCLTLILLMYGLLFFFHSHIPEPWTALIAVALLIVYRILRYWLHPPVKRNGLLNA